MQNEIFILALKKARKAKKLSQQEAARRIGITQSHLSKIEKGTIDPRLSTFNQLALVLDLEPVLVPRVYNLAVKTMIRGESLQQPRWQRDRPGEFEDVDE